jgi:excisionase family DNA binding protein
MRDGLGATMNKVTAAEIIGISVPTLDKWIDRGLLPTERVGNTRRIGVARDAVLELAERVDALRRAGEKRNLVAAAVERLQHEDETYQAEFAELYGPGLRALAAGDLVSAAPPSSFGPED